MNVIAYDLGTGGMKASLYGPEGECLASHFAPYDTHYPQSGWHEQRPDDWWAATVAATRNLLRDWPGSPESIGAIGISGHSLGVVPLDDAGRLLREQTPIWSDSRARDQARQFFTAIDEEAWYRRTGCGFPPPLYSVFKIMWYRDHEPAMFRTIRAVVGTKDYVNCRLTGRIATDFSYASGTGVYDLLQWDYAADLIGHSGLSAEIFPAILPSTEVLGELTPAAATELGLPRTVKVVCGGVDNSCMALGAGNIAEGRVYNSLGSSSWIAACSARPLLDPRARPYVFTHVLPGLFTSATSIFSAGTSLRWVRDTLCQNLVAEAGQRNVDVYDHMIDVALESPVGARKLLFNPSLAGGNCLDASPNLRGAFMGLDLGHTQADVIRATLEGIALGLRVALDELRRLTTLAPRMLVVGGGSRNRHWRQIYADVYGMEIVKTVIDQQAAALGAAALAAVGSGLWQDFTRIDAIHRIEDVSRPNPAQRGFYEALLPVFIEAGKGQARLGDLLAALPTGPQP